MHTAGLLPGAEYQAGFYAEPLLLLKPRTDGRYHAMVPMVINDPSELPSDITTVDLDTRMFTRIRRPMPRPPSQ